MQELQVVDFGMPHYMKVVELALRAGWPVLLQNVMETLDPSIMPILNKTVVLQGEIIVFTQVNRNLHSEGMFFLSMKNMFCENRVALKPRLTSFYEIKTVQDIKNSR